jgi:hypothetical protein
VGKTITLRVDPDERRAFFRRRARGPDLAFELDSHASASEEGPSHTHERRRRRTGPRACETGFSPLGRGLDSA